MTNLDKIIEYLHYHQGANRRELMDMLNLGVKDTQMKALLSEGIAKGDIRVEGKARATRYFIAWKARHGRLGILLRPRLRFLGR